MIGIFHVYMSVVYVCMCVNMCTCEGSREATGIFLFFSTVIIFSTVESFIEPGAHHRAILGGHPVPAIPGLDFFWAYSWTVTPTGDSRDPRTGPHPCGLHGCNH